MNSVLPLADLDTCDNLLTKQFILDHGIPYDPEEDDYRCEPLVTEIRVGKNTVAYRTHSYPTKVPCEGIIPFIRHFSKPGDLIVDPFCGSGMTGVASLLLGRNVLLADISPAAVHIAHNYITPCDPNALRGEGQRILQCLEAEVSFQYGTVCDRCKGPATIEYSVWSDVFACEKCGGEFLYWDRAVDHTKGSVRPVLTCPVCGTTARKQKLQWRRSLPVSTKYSCNLRCRPLVERPITSAESSLSSRIEEELILDWYPTAPFGRNREMWRKSHQVMGIKNVDGFYTRRNLGALAVLWRHIQLVQDQYIKKALEFAFTATVNRASKRYQWNAKRPTNVQTGTLYISSLNYEWNVISLFRRKLRDIVAYYKSFIPATSKAFVANTSARELGDIPSNSIDYIFTDPPFGSNIYYADCALLWESWLNVFTDEREQIVINRKVKPRDGGKSLTDYQCLMTEAFARMHCILKPGRWASIVFHSSDPKVWRAIQDAIKNVGFELRNTTSLDKGQPSIKGLKGLRGEESVPAVDVILHVCKSKGAIVSVNPGIVEIELKELVLQALRNHLSSLPSRIIVQPEAYSNEQRRTQHLHSLSVRALLDCHVPFKDVSFEYVADLCEEHFELKEGYWFLPDEDLVGVRGANQLDLLKEDNG